MGEFKVGDRVHYEQVEPEGEWGEVNFKDQVFTVVGFSYHGDGVRIKGVNEQLSDLTQTCKPVNLRKVDSITIEHPIHGRVEGVSWWSSNGWEKECFIYLKYLGWSRVKVKEWVDITGECVLSGSSILHNDKYTTHHPYRRVIRDNKIIIEKEMEK